MKQSLLLFGYPQIYIDNDPTDTKSRKGLALLSYLAITQQPQSRDTLAGLLCPEYDQRLRRTLYNLNRTPVVDWLASDREMLQLKEEIRTDVDVVQFEERLEDGSIGAQQNAVELYREDFLNGYSLPDSERTVDEWTVMQRARLQWMVLTTLETLTDHHLEAGDWEEAIAAARRQLVLDNLRESAWATTDDCPGTCWSPQRSPCYRGAQMDRSFTTRMKLSIGRIDGALARYADEVFIALDEEAEVQVELLH